MSFNFSATAGASQSTAKPQLEGNKIHTIKFESCKSEDVESKATKTIYKVLKFRYSNEDGYYEHTIWEPNDKDKERTVFETTKGDKIPQPSGIESMMLFFKHNMDAFVPALAAEIDAGTKALSAPDWEGMRKLMVAIMKNGEGVESKIKLVTNNKGEATFPGFYTGITREGKAYIRNNFIGNKVMFDSFELNRIKNQTTAVPTAMPKDDFKLEDTPTSTNIDLNFDIASL